MEKRCISSGCTPSTTVSMRGSGQARGRSGRERAALQQLPRETAAPLSVPMRMLATIQTKTRKNGRRVCNEYAGPRISARVKKKSRSRLFLSL